MQKKKYSIINYFKFTSKTAGNNRPVVPYLNQPNLNNLASKNNTVSQHLTMKIKETITKPLNSTENGKKRGV